MLAGSVTGAVVAVLDQKSRHRSSAEVVFQLRVIPLYLWLDSFKLLFNQVYLITLTSANRYLSSVGSNPSTAEIKGIFPLDFSRKCKHVFFMR